MSNPPQVFDRLHTLYRIIEILDVLTTIFYSLDIASHREVGTLAKVTMVV